MTASFARPSLRRSARFGLAAAAVLLAVHGASAEDDAGVHAFFSSVFGGAAAQSSPAPQPVQEESPVFVRRLPRSHSRPLTVRLHNVRPTMVVAQGPSKPEPVSIFEDRTLRPGDAVMMAGGMRIFAGSTSWPYTPSDFVGLDEAHHLNKGTADVLAALDRLPRG